MNLEYVLPKDIEKRSFEIIESELRDIKLDDDIKPIFMADENVALAAKADGSTRAAASVDKAARLGKPVIYAVGNAPTALVRICEHMENGTFTPEFVIGAPVGFVNVVQSKELLIASGVPCIVARGRKGGSNVAAAICNALLYMLDAQNAVEL